jgi:sulfate adenylyltransferase
MSKEGIEARQSVDLIEPFGGKLVNLMVEPDEYKAVEERANTLPSIQLSQRSTCDLEIMATGGFSPVRQFMGREDFESVIDTARLADSQLFPIPITLPVVEAEVLHLDAEIALRDSRNRILGIMHIAEIYEWDRLRTAKAVFGTDDVRHPLVAEMERWGEVHIAGSLRVLDIPRHHDFTELRLTPAKVREQLSAKGRVNVIAFQTRNPLHRAHEEMVERAVQQLDGVALLHPVVGMTKPGDVDHYTRVRTYKALAANHFDPNRILLAVVPLAMRFAGPREAVWHAIIRRNYGANHLVIGRHHASPGLDSGGQPFYEPRAAQAMTEEHSAELGVGLISYDEMVYLPDQDRFELRSEVSPAAEVVSMSGSRLREDYLNTGEEIPAWYLRKEVTEILRDAYPPRHKQGVCIWFTGLSGAGKSTTAEIVTELLLERGRQMTLLDGDVVRTHLSKGLGFSKADRDANIRRIGFVAAEIVRHGGVAVCAAVSPYRATRNDVRNMVGSDRFIEVFVDTPLEECERRDAKGMYAKARRGEITGFTGIDDPYEAPLNAEIVLDTIKRTAIDNAALVIEVLSTRGFLRHDEGDSD